MLFQIAHANKNSSFGEANTFTISIQTNIADEQSYLQTAFITDNVEGYEFRKAMLKDQYHTEAVYLLNKDELTIHATANSLFAGWTVPIPLLSQKYLLPPANLIFKGSGKIQTYSTELKGLMNRRLTYEFNCLEAFVTFMLPFARYYSPATDGLFYRECIVTSYPSFIIERIIRPFLEMKTLNLKWVAHDLHIEICRVYFEGLTYTLRYTISNWNCIKRHNHIIGNKTGY